MRCGACANVQTAWICVARIVAQGRHVVLQARDNHVIGKKKIQNRNNKMATATGDEAAAMDSISRAPTAHLAALSASGASGGVVEAPEDGAEAAASAPKKGNCSDGGVETAEEAVEPAQPDINELCTDMFEKMAIFLQGELTATCEDYRLLENMNKLTSLKYMEMKDISINISRNLQDLNNKYASLQPYLDQINEIEDHVTSLEQSAYKLDAYSKKLEARFKKLEKR